MNKFLTVVFFGFIAGVALRSFYNVELIGMSLLFVVAFGLFLYWLSVRKKEVFLISIIFLSVFLGALRFDIADLKNGDPLLDKEIGTEVTLKGVITDEPDERDTHVKITMTLSDVFVEEEFIELSSRVRARVLVPHYPEWNYGDEIIISGVLNKPENFVNELTGKEFDYVSFLDKDDIFYEMFFPEVEHIASRKGNTIKQALFDVKNAFLKSMSKSIPEPHASLAGGLIVGAKQSLGEELLDDFRKVGIIHIVVLSGYNVTIVAEALMRFFSFLPRIASLWVGAGSIVLFTIMTGAGATIVRASIMALLVIFARATGRLHDMKRLLFIAGFFMILHNPKILMFDLSFQLSFLATLGLLYGAPILEKKLGGTLDYKKRKFQLRELAVATLATQIFVLPLILYQMGEISLVALPVNLLILMLIPLTMLFGFLAGIVGFVSTILALPFSFIAYALLEYELTIVDLFSKLSFASIEVHNFTLWMMIGMYVLYAWVVHFLHE